MYVNDIGLSSQNHTPHHCQTLNMSKWHLIQSSQNHNPLHCTLLLFSFVSIFSFVYSAPFWSLPFLLFSTSLLSSLQLLPLTSFLINRILSHLVSHWIFCWCLFAHHFTLCVPFLTLDLSHYIYTPTKKVFEGLMILFLLIMHVSVQEIYSSLSENGEDCDAKVSWLYAMEAISPTS